MNTIWPSEGSEQKEVCVARREGEGDKVCEVSMQGIESEDSRCDRDVKECWRDEGDEGVGRDRIQGSNIDEGPRGAEGEGAHVESLVKSDE